MSKQNSDPDPKIPSTELSPPSDDTYSEERTQSQPNNKRSPYIPNNNNMWQANEHIFDAEGVEYRIERELGQGGFGITYLAVEIASNNKVVIKILKLES